MLAYLMVGLALICLFDKVNGLWSPVGPAFWRLGLGAYDQIRQLQLPWLVAGEYTLAIALLLLLYFPQVSNRWLRYLLPVVPIVLLFVQIDAFFEFLARIPHLADLRSLEELYLVRWYYGIAATLLLLAPFASVAVLLVLAGRDYGGRGLGRTLGGRAVALIAGLAALLSPVGDSFASSFVVMRWSELFTVQSNGRLASFFYYARRDIANRRVLARFTDLADIPAALYPGVPGNKRNVYLIVLESFVDPRLFEGISYSRSPLADELKPFLLQSGTGFSHIVSPVYGGGTARACFEVLAGLPSLGLVEPVEFNLLRAGKVQAFAWQLARNGYDTLATTAATSEYFNEPRAYASLSLDGLRFLADPGSGFTPRPGDKEVFDGDLFDQSLRRLAERQATAGGRPLLSYLLGMYGHYPYHRNYALRPDVVHDDSRIADVARIANQFYYRTQALGRYLSQLKAQDPTAIVFISADHIPAILQAGIRYRLDKYQNSALLLDGWRPVDISGRRQYEIPWLIWDRLRGMGDGRRQIAPSQMERLYYTALRQSVDGS